MTQPWHTRYDFSRAFFKPRSWRQRAALWLRGWRPFHTGSGVWSKAGPGGRR